MTPAEANGAAPPVAVVTVLYRSGADVLPHLRSLAAQSYPHAQITIHLVENDPGDGSLAAVEAARDELGPALPELVIHKPGTNLGFAAGNNLALREIVAQGRARYVYLLNPDAALEPDALTEAVRAAEDAQARHRAGNAPPLGAVQSLLVLDDQPDTVNSRGNEIHYLGFAFCGGYLEPRAAVPDAVVDIAYASGACVLMPLDALADVGLFDETLWLYHEDVDLGWRLRLAGRAVLLAPRSVCRHRYEFSRTTSKFYFLERNRIAVLLKHYRAGTLALLSPQLAITELALLVMAARGGWLPQKLRALGWFAKPTTWSYLRAARRESQASRRVSDRELLDRFSAEFRHPDYRHPLVERVAEPAWRASKALLARVVRW